MKKYVAFLKLSGFLISLIFIFFSIKYLASWFFDSVRIENQVEEIDNIVEIKEVESDEDDLVIEIPEEEENPYWKYIGMSMADVELADLKGINDETKGWIQVMNTNVNYPFVQHNDNTFYLTHSFDKQKNNAGWVFLDYRNNIENLDRNNILYAHGRVNSVLFGTLRNTIEDGWYMSSDNQIVRISTESHNTLWQIFSIYVIPTTSDYIVTEFSNDETFLNFLNFIKNRSIYDFGMDLTSEDKILTLSTCYSSKEKLVIHAKLVKFSSK